MTTLQALGVPGVKNLAGVWALARGGAGPPVASALSPANLLGLGGSGGGGGLSSARGRGGAGDKSGGGLGGGAGAAGDGGSTGGLGGEDAGDGGPGGLLAELGIVDEGIAGAVERGRNPRVLVGERPDGDTDAARHVEAGPDDVGKVVTLGDLGLGAGGEGGVADVELSVGDIDTEGGEAAEGGGQVGAAGRAADDQVALEANTVNGGTGSLDDADNLDGPVSLGLIVLEVVVIIVPKDSQVRNIISRYRMQAE